MDPRQIAIHIMPAVRSFAVTAIFAASLCSTFCALPARADDVFLGPASGAAVMVHGGVRSPLERTGQVAAAADAAWKALSEGKGALDAAVAAAVVLENDPDFNAGTGSNIRLDGETVQMDAAVMTSRGDFGAVAIIERVKNPVLVARGVMDSPHLIVAGDGATRLARTLGMPDYDPRVPESQARYEQLQYRMDNDMLGGDWSRFDWREHWNFPNKYEPAPIPEEFIPNDTIGVVVHDGRGGFAVAISTGGTSATLSGRVGDVAMMGAGSFAGPAGAVCATGWGEYIIRRQLSRRVYDWMEQGVALGEAVDRGIALFPDSISIGLIAVSRTGVIARANASMAWAGYEGGVPVRADVRAEVIRLSGEPIAQD